MRVLVVEDTLKVAQLIKRGLARESFAVDTCDTGDEALELVASESYQVIILDRRLPGRFEGAELCREFRRRGIHTPILLLTAKDRTEDKIEGLDSGADDYLVKPFDFNELVARVRALARRPQAATPVVLQYDELSLDTATKMVQRAGKTITLTAKEYSLLEYFMRHPKQVMSKDAIIRHVWDYDSVVISNNVEVYMRMLRSKVDRPFAYPLLQTIRGLGYKLEVPK